MSRLVTIVGIALGVVIFVWAFTRLFRIDLEPILIDTTRLLSGGRLVEFDEVFVSGFDSTMRVCNVHRVDADGDGFREWVVFYQIDTTGQKSIGRQCPDESPRLGAVYDNDRGTPGVVFPYSLTPLKRDFLGEEGVILEIADIVDNLSENGGNNAPELFVYGRQGGLNNQLTIFKFQQNSQPWQPPRDEPPRYEVIGSFVGSGGVSYDPEEQEVTVQDQAPFGRSQLAVKNVYRLRGTGVNETFMSETDSKVLAAPIESTIDFYLGPPNDIFLTEFPEKIVLAFYQSLDQNIEGTAREWDSRDFLAFEGTASRNFDLNNLGYFFGTDVNDRVTQNQIRDLSVLQLRYFPIVEELTTADASEGGLSVPSEPREGRVDIQVHVEGVGTVTAAYKMVFIRGKWLIDERIQ